MLWRQFFMIIPTNLCKARVEIISVNRTMKLSQPIATKTLRNPHHVPSFTPCIQDTHACSSFTSEDTSVHMGLTTEHPFHPFHVVDTPISKHMQCLYGLTSQWAWMIWVTCDFIHQKCLRLLIPNNWPPILGNVAWLAIAQVTLPVSCETYTESHQIYASGALAAAC